MTVAGQHPAARSASPAPATIPAQPGWAIWATVLFIGQRPRWQRLGLAVLIVLAAVALRVAFLSGLGRGTAYITFYPAVMMAALCGGWGAGLLASTLCTLLAYAWIQQSQLTPTEWLALAVFVASSALVSALSELLHRAVRRLRAEVDGHTRAEAARNESETLYHAVLENLDYAVLLARPDGTILSANPAACRLFDRTEADLCAGGRAALVDSTDPRLPLHLADRDTHGRCRSPLRFRRRDATTFEGEIASTLFLDSTGSPRVSIVIRDRTAQHRAAAQLERAAQEWQTTFDATRDAVWVLDRDHRIVRANRTAELRFGRPAAEMIGHPCWEIAHGTTAPIPECPLSRAASSLQRATTELPRGDRWWEIIVDPILDEAGQFAGAVHSVSDITDRKRSQEALQESEARFKYVFENSNVGKSLTRPSGELQVNRALCDLLGYSSAELQGRTWQSITHPEDVEPTTRIVANLLSGERDSSRFTKRFLHKNGTVIWADLSTTLRRDAAGQPLYFMTTVIDITERKHAEAQLRDQFVLLRGIVESVDTPIFSVDTAGRYTCFNQQHAQVMQALYGCRIEIGQSLFDYQQDETDRRLAHAHLERAYRGERVIAEAFSGPDEKTRSYFEVLHSPIRDELGRVCGVAVMARDLTVRKRSEEALREAERFARATIDALSAHLCVLDETGAILATNQAWRQFVEANPPATTNAQTGANYLAICDAATGPEAADARAFATGIRSVMSGEHPTFSLEYPCHSPTEQRWFVGRVTRFADTGPVRLVVVHENITQRRQAEEALRAAHANLEHLVHERTAALSETNRLLAQTSHLAQVGGWEVDLRTGSNIWSGATREIHEVTEDFVPTVETALSFYAPEAQPLITAAVQRTSTTGEPFDLELPFITSKGTRLWVRATGQAVREQDRVVKIRGVFQDITERRRAEDELRTHRDQLETLLAERTAANERLRELDRLKSEFLSTMSHELRTPLNSIVGFTGILLKELSGPLNPEQNKQLGLVQSSARHLLALINDLLDLSRIESGRIELHHESFDFAAVVSEVVAFLSPIAQQKALALHADCSPVALPLVGDRRRTLQILLNLATNAVKFTAHGEVAIAAHLHDGRLVVAVRDTGIGIRPDQLPLLFEAFRQLDASARRHYEGTGLGLHLCKKLLGLLGGTITVESTAGVGSTFTFTLPLAPAAPGGTGLPTREPASAHGSGDPCHAPPGGAGFIPAIPPPGGAGFTPAIPPPGGAGFIPAIPPPGGAGFTPAIPPPGGAGFTPAIPSSAPQP